MPGALFSVALIDVPVRLSLKRTFDAGLPPAQPPPRQIVTAALAGETETSATTAARKNFAALNIYVASPTNQLSNGATFRPKRTEPLQKRLASCKVT